MEITQKQEEKFKVARNKLLDTIYSYRKGIEYAESVTGQEIKKSWLDLLEERVKRLNIEYLQTVSEKDYGYEIRKYQDNIEEVFLREFSHVADGFEVDLARYQGEIYSIFM